MNSSHTKHLFHVHGMHCHSCVLLIEDAIGELQNIRHVKSSLKHHTLEVEGDFGTKTEEEIAYELTQPIAAHGYSVSPEKAIHNKKWHEFKIALPIALGFAVVFVVLQKLGIVNLVDGGNLSYGTAFIIGIIASLSTCMAVVGGLLLSMSATFAKSGSKIQPQLMFHIGRIVSFFVLGGIIGAIGVAFTINATITFVLSLLIGVIMLVLGINLLDVFPWAKKLQLSMPKFISRRAHGVSKLNTTLTPLLVGIATFFLPCGFTQSMQIFTLTTGGFMQGGLTMLAFALGTLPALALISFGSFSIQKSPKAGIFFKTAGIVVILFAVFNILSGLVVAGILPPLFNF